MYLRTLFFVGLAGAVTTSACTTAESHSDAGSGTGGSSTGTGGASNGSGGSSTTGAGGKGSGGTTGAGGQASGTGGSNAGGATGTGCGSLPLCDDFESGPLNTTRWTLISPSNSGTATVDTIGAHESGHSLKVVSPDRLYLRNSSVIGTLGSVVHVRFYARFMTALPAGHGAIIVTHNPAAPDVYSQQNELRFGSQDAVFHWNTDSDAANIPTVGPGDSSSMGVTPDTWYCYELTINSMNGHLNVSIDGNDVPGLAEDGVPTPNIDQDWIGSSDASLSPSLLRYTAFGDFNFGWQSYGGGPMTIWFDDVALSGAPIGCSN
jgi:hypothetical protein